MFLQLYLARMTLNYRRMQPSFCICCEYCCFRGGFDCTLRADRSDPVPDFIDDVVGVLNGILVKTPGSLGRSHVKASSHDHVHKSHILDVCGRTGTDTHTRSSLSAVWRAKHVFVHVYVHVRVCIETVHWLSALPSSF